MSLYKSWWKIKMYFCFFLVSSTVFGRCFCSLFLTSLNWLNAINIKLQWAHWAEFKGRRSEAFLPLKKGFCEMDPIFNVCHTGSHRKNKPSQKRLNSCHYWITTATFILLMPSVSCSASSSIRFNTLPEALFPLKHCSRLHIDMSYQYVIFAYI